MSNNPGNLDLIQANQSQKEVTANALFTAASPAMIYGRREQTSSGLVWGFYGGVVKTGSGYLTIANGTVTLTNTSDNYVEARLDTGAVVANTTGFTSGRLALYKVTVAGGVATAWIDYRQALLGAEGAATLAFTDLTDTPADYSGQSGKAVIVKSDETGLEFFDLPAPGAQDFTDLGDAPASYTGQAGKVVKVNGTEDGLEFATDAGGVTEFVDLDDVPSSFSGQANKLVAVNGAANALVFVDAPTPGAADFTDLGDVPASYTGQAGKIPAVNGAEDGLEFIDAPSGSGFERAFDDTDAFPGSLFFSLRSGVVRLPDGSSVDYFGSTYSLTDDATTYVEAVESFGSVVVNTNTTGWTPGASPLWEIVTSSGAPVSKTDRRPTFSLPSVGGGGAVDFTDLGDVPTSYTGQGGKLVAVNPSATALEFVDAPDPGAADFTDLGDVPASYTGQAGKVVKVNGTEDGLEFATDAGGVTSFVDLDDVPSSYIGQAGKVAVVNGTEDALEFATLPAGVEDNSLFAQKSSTTTGLTWGYYGGSYVGYYQALYNLSDGTVSLADDATNYIQLQRSNGVVSVNQVGFDRQSRLPLATVVTAAGAIVSYVDERQKLVGAQSFKLGTTAAEYAAGYPSPVDFAYNTDGQGKKAVYLEDDGFFYYRPVPYKVYDISDYTQVLDGFSTDPTVTFAPGRVRLSDGTEEPFAGISHTMQQDADHYFCVERATGDFTVVDTVVDPGATDFPDPITYMPLWKITTVAGNITAMEDHRVSADLAERPMDSISAVFDGGGSVIATGKYVDVIVPYACAIRSWTMLADQTGNLTVEVWKDTYANFPPTSGDDITGAAPPTIGGTIKNQGTTSAWSFDVAAGDIIRFQVSAATTITRATLTLTVQRK